MAFATSYRKAFCPFFFFTDPATTEIYTLSLHDALQIAPRAAVQPPGDGDLPGALPPAARRAARGGAPAPDRGRVPAGDAGGGARLDAPIRRSDQVGHPGGHCRVGEL